MALLSSKGSTSVILRSCRYLPSRYLRPCFRHSSTHTETNVQSTKPFVREEDKVVVTGFDHLSDQDLIKRYGNVALHADLRIDTLARKQILTHEFLDASPCRLIRRSLKGHLPSGHDPIATNDWFHLGYQQIFFRPSLTPKQLLPDGTDTRFLPGNQAIWQYRLWAGGSVTYNVDGPYNIANPTRAFQLEVVKDIRILGKEAPEKVFVTIRRIIAKQDRLIKDISREETIKLLLQPKNPPLEEEYTLCFLRNPPRDSTDRPGISPPADALFSHTMTPDSNLLFQFSALTYNAHKIHLSPEYAQREYGMKHTVVHGPFTQVLLAEFMRRSMNIHDRTRDEGIRFVKSINYTNLRPLYADEPMTLCCKPLGLIEGQTPWEARSWRVWIQTGQGDKASLAVKAVVEIGVKPTQSEAIRSIKKPWHRLGGNNQSKVPQYTTAWRQVSIDKGDGSSPSEDKRQAGGRPNT